MTIEADAWCTVHYTMRYFTALCEIGQLHKGLRTKSFHFGLLCLYFDLGACVQDMMQGAENSGHVSQGIYCETTKVKNF